MKPKIKIFKWVLLTTKGSEILGALRCTLKPNEGFKISKYCNVMYKKMMHGEGEFVSYPL